MKLIVGLGNPGKEYEQTRHNIGFIIIDEYCKGEKFSQKFNGLYIDRNVNGNKVIFLKPQSYMNLSGTVVKSYKDYFKIKDEDILVIRDDLDIPTGQAKLKFDSASGGDNGIKSIIEHLGTKKFSQFKIGISNDKNQNTKDYVLGRLSKNEMEQLKKIINESKNIIDCFIEYGIEKTMCDYNGLLK